MCLRKVSELKVAEKDIEVIKYLKATLVSPFRDFQYTMGGTVAVDLDLWDSSKEEVKQNKDWAAIRYGLHTHKEELKPDDPEPRYTENRSRRHDQWDQLTRIDNCRAFRAIIPAGTEYFEGEDDWQQPAYASQKLRIVGVFHT